MIIFEIPIIFIIILLLMGVAGVSWLVNTIGYIVFLIALVFSFVIGVLYIISIEKNSFCAALRHFITGVFVAVAPYIYAHLSLITFEHSKQFVMPNATIGIQYQSASAWFEGVKYSMIIIVVFLIINFLVDILRESKSKILKIIFALLDFVLIIAIWVILSISFDKSIERRVAYNNDNVESVASYVVNQDTRLKVYVLTSRRVAVGNTGYFIPFDIGQKVTEGEVFKATPHTKKDNDVKYIEIYNDNYWGYVAEDQLTLIE